MKMSRDQKHDGCECTKKPQGSTLYSGQRGEFYAMGILPQLSKREARVKIIVHYAKAPTGYFFMCFFFFFLFFFLNVCLFLRQRETGHERGRSREREGDTESEAGSRL